LDNSYFYSESGTPPPLFVCVYSGISKSQGPMTTSDPEHVAIEFSIKKQAAYSNARKKYRPGKRFREVKCGSPGEVARVDVFYYTSEWLLGVYLSPHPGFSKVDMETVPAALERAGLSKDVWCEWTSKLKDANDGPRLPCSMKILSWFSCLFGVFCLLNPLILWLGCWINRRADRRWAKRLFDWQHDFNVVLEPLGIFCKTQSNCTVQKGTEKRSDGGTRETKTRIISRWITFAFTQEAIAKLEAEPHLSGEILSPGSCCFGSFANQTESECPCHPCNINEPVYEAG
jgi:hypothetical protein